METELLRAMGTRKTASAQVRSRQSRSLTSTSSSPRSSECAKASDNRFQRGRSKFRIVVSVLLAALLNRTNLGGYARFASEFRAKPTIAHVIVGLADVGDPLARRDDAHGGGADRAIEAERGIGQGSANRRWRHA